MLSLKEKTKMREPTHLKIGEFSRVGQVSIATLRYYTLDQLSRLNRILALKDFGFPLEQIARLLEENLSLDQLRAMFTLKQAQARHVINIEQARLARISARLCQIEQEGI